MQRRISKAYRRNWKELRTAFQLNAETSIPRYRTTTPPSAPSRRIFSRDYLVFDPDHFSKPKPVQMSRPEYTEEARSAGIEGKVRVELTVDASGVVRNVKVLESLGHGLDEAALAAVQAASFEPAYLCGKPVEATFVVSIRFSL